jgi:two-component system, chemotaxis family, response regulator Rcp1
VVPKKIIFADDSPLDHFILKRILHRYNLAYEVNCTADVQEVLDYLDANRWDKVALPDIILLDIYMPEADGWAFLEKVQKLYPSLSKPLRIYILSSSINPRDINRAKQFPFVKSFIFKPITKEVLEKLISEEAPDAIR